MSIWSFFAGVFFWYSFFLFPRTFAILCELFNKHPTNVRGRRGAFHGFLSMPSLRLEACVSITRCKSLVAGDKSGDQSETFSSTQRWPRLLTATWKRLTACVSFQGVINEITELSSITLWFCGVLAYRYHTLWRKIPVHLSSDSFPGTKPLKWKSIQAYGNRQTRHFSTNIASDI